jgi:hypothetical protein
MAPPPDPGQVEGPACLFLPVFPAGATIRASGRRSRVGVADRMRRDRRERPRRGGREPDNCAARKTGSGQLTPVVYSRC